MSIDVTAEATLSARVAEEIRVLMARRRMKQSQLARLLGVNDQWVSVRLRGAQEIGLNDLQAIAAALGVQPAALLGETASTERYGSKKRPVGVRPAQSPSTKTTARPPSYPHAARRPQLQSGRSGR